jgi:hypothetical protein
MITKKKHLLEVRRLTANCNALALENDYLTADNAGLLKERNELREVRGRLEAENKALLETVSMLTGKIKALDSENRNMKLKIMSLEALWGAKQRRMRDVQSA